MSIISKLYCVINVEIIENAVHCVAYITMFCDSDLHVHIPIYPMFLILQVKMIFSFNYITFVVLIFVAPYR